MWCFKVRTCFLNPLANSADPDQTASKEQSDLDLYYSSGFRPECIEYIGNCLPEKFSSKRLIYIEYHVSVC